MAYKPFKMKGHTLPGIKQRPSAKMADGRASSSPLQDNGKPTKNVTVKTPPPSPSSDTLSAYIHQRHGWKLEEDQAEAAKAFEDAHNRLKGHRVTDEEMRRSSKRYEKEEAAKESSPAKSNGDKGKYKPGKGDKKIDLSKFTNDEIVDMFKRRLSKEGFRHAREYDLRTDSVLAGYAELEKRHAEGKFKAKKAKEKSSPNKWAQFIPAAISAISAIKKSKEDK